MEEKIELSKYIPKRVICGKNQKEYPYKIFRKGIGYPKNIVEVVSCC